MPAEAAGLALELISLEGVVVEVSNSKLPPFGRVLLNELWRLCVVRMEVLCMFITPWASRESSFLATELGEVIVVVIVEAICAEDDLQDFWWF